MNHNDSERVLLLTPHGRDSEVACRILQGAGMECRVCADVPELCAEIAAGAGAVLLAAEALPRRAAKQLLDALDRQPSWSELPILLFAMPGPERIVPIFGELRDRHFTVLDRPIGVKALVTMVRGALRWRRRQYQVRGLMEALENRIHERDKFLAILGHELRNPLGAILLASQLIDPNDAASAADHASLIERQSRHLTRLVDDLLDLSRVTAGKIVLQKESIDFNTVVTQALSTLGDMVRANKHTVTRALSSEALHVYGDPTRLEQIVSNLLTNAIKYTPPGGEITVTTARESDSIVFHVRDNGLGIEKERVEQIFGLFTQADHTIGRAQGGMGIGLSLVRNLVELHKGTVAATSEGLGKGSEFTVTLPATDAEIAISAPESGRDAEATPAPLTRTIVVVEDNADVRTLLQLKLKRLGHEVEAIGDGETAINRIALVRPDLALVDIGLPGVDGYTVARSVRQSIGDAVFLVALSGFGQPEDKRRALEAGFNEHLTKPADVSDIEQLLTRIPRREENDGG